MIDQQNHRMMTFAKQPAKTPRIILHCQSSSRHACNICWPWRNLIKSGCLGYLNFVFVKNVNNVIVQNGSSSVLTWIRCILHDWINLFKSDPTLGADLQMGLWISSESNWDFMWHRKDTCGAVNDLCLEKWRKFALNDTKSEEILFCGFVAAQSLVFKQIHFFQRHLR